MSNPRCDRGLFRRAAQCAAIAITLLALEAHAQNYCCVCQPVSDCGPNPCSDVCGIVADAAACESFCGGQSCTTGSCVPFVNECSIEGNDCGSGPGLVCDSTKPGLCCDPNVAGSDCAPTSTATSTQTATVTQTPTSTPTRLANGEICTEALGCASRNCVDGVCCDTACDRPHEQCNVAGQRGTCISVAAPAPALTLSALVLAAVALAACGTFALRRMARSGRPR